MTQPTEPGKMNTQESQYVEISLENGFVYLQRTRLATASEQPLSEVEQVILALYRRNAALTTAAREALRYVTASDSRQLHDTHGTLSRSEVIARLQAALQGAEDESR